ncbi:unnamed protein product [Spirodela intermedia]|uniref:EF-hand domain-containing protein n=1 Tax=Spirodela intermedia TaxID=51605 RepID=A0A7I8IB37_SPIIN|nr:unnamed protein product [Spirodela intermedia]CAA6654101.1 unnamed protein product [Spirodela intermedia]
MRSTGLPPPLTSPPRRSPYYPPSRPKALPCRPPAVSELFCVFDRDGDGKITKEELELVLGRLGKSDPPTEEELSMMMAEVDRDGDGCISLEEFGVLAPRPAVLWLGRRRQPGARRSEGRAAGRLPNPGDDRCTLDDCRGMIRGVDSRGDGYVCFDDFVRMMGGQR